MANRAFQKSQIVWYWLLLILIGLLCTAVIYTAYNQYGAQGNNSHYASPFQSRIHSTTPSKTSGGEEEQKSYEPHSPGLKESDIRKIKGRRYETY